MNNKVKYLKIRKVVKEALDTYGPLYVQEYEYFYNFSGPNSIERNVKTLIPFYNKTNKLYNALIARDTILNEPDNDYWEIKI